jgi:alkanesulfonate monooxygenase SsuD/methylene tetrahydromethanopterin reductase-like flavin-dependent oxidoreductase (luciferase family)
MALPVFFDFSANPTDAMGASDAQLYQARIKLAKLGDSLGYTAAWSAEHHFSDYYRTPSPAVALSQIAGVCPTLGLGACVYVLPWYQPLRLAGELAMLSNMTSGKIHVGVGRGTAPMEHESFGVDMADTQGVFEDSLAIIRRALEGGEFTYEGKYKSAPRAVELRPRARKDAITFYGPYLNAGSIRKYAAFDLPFLASGYSTPEEQAPMVADWAAAMNEFGFDANQDRVNWVHAIVCDTDDEARDLARKVLPPFFEMQAKHYEVDAVRYENIKGYESWGGLFASLADLATPEATERLLEHLLIGSPNTVAERIQRQLDAGFNRIIVHADLHFLEYVHAARSLTLFAKEVAPRFTPEFGAQRQAAE